MPSVLIMAVIASASMLLPRWAAVAVFAAAVIGTDVADVRSLAGRSIGSGGVANWVALDTIGWFVGWLAIYGCAGGDLLVGAKATGALTACSFAPPISARVDEIGAYWETAVRGYRRYATNATAPTDALDTTCASTIAPNSVRSPCGAASHTAARRSPITISSNRP